MVSASFVSETMSSMEDEKYPEKGTCILVVAAQENVRKILQEATIMAGYQCVVAASGLEVLDQLSENSIDIVITDIKMPLMDGLELTTQILDRFDANVIVMAGFTDNYTFEEIITRGASELILKPVYIPELYMRIRRVLRETTLLRERNSAMQKLRDSERRYQAMSITDGLTKLFNSRQFYNVFHTEIERSRRYDHPLTILMLDNDDFKKYNDTYGNFEGDKVLIRFAEIIQNCFASERFGLPLWGRGVCSDPARYNWRTGCDCSRARPDSITKRGFCARLRRKHPSHR